MARLTVEKMPCTNSMDTMKITGFSDGELSELKSMEHMESKMKILDMLDNRNDGLGTQWMCGYGVFGHWFDNEAAYVNIGKDCD